MSFDLDPQAIVSPYANGLREGDDPDDGSQFFYTAYRHPHTLTWFAGTRRRPGRLEEYGVWIHYVQSSVQIHKIPPKPDYQIAAINYDMYVALVDAEYVVSLALSRLGMRAEREFWEDYNDEHARLVAQWGAEEYLGLSIALLPGSPRKFHAAAIKYAHRRVAQRAGREDDLPEDFDERELIHEEDVLDWDD